MDESLNIDSVDEEYNDNKLCAKINSYYFSGSNELIFDIDVINEKVINDFINKDNVEFGIRSLAKILDEEWKDLYQLVGLVEKYNKVYFIEEIYRFVIVYEDK